MARVISALGFLFLAAGLLLIGGRWSAASVPLWGFNLPLGLLLLVSFGLGAAASLCLLGVTLASLATRNKALRRFRGSGSAPRG